MRKQIKVGIFVVALAAILTGAVVAEFLLSKEIQTTITIKPVVSMDVYDIDGVTPLTSVELGQFEWDTTFYFPGHSAGIPSQHYFINNTDQVSFYVSMAAEGEQVGSTIGFDFWVKRGDQENFQGVGTGSCYPFPIESPDVNPDPATQYAVWYFKVWVSNPPFGTYNAKIIVSAYSTSSG